MSMFDVSPSFVNRSKATSSRLQPNGVYVGVVTRTAANSVYVQVPKISGDVEYGPCIYSGVQPAVGERMLVGFLDNQLSQLVCYGTLTKNAAPLANPNFTGTPTAPTPPTQTYSTQVATTAFVQDVVAASQAVTVPEAASTTRGTVFGHSSEYQDYTYCFHNPVTFTYASGSPHSVLTLQDGKTWAGNFGINPSLFFSVGRTYEVADINSAFFIRGILESYTANSIVFRSIQSSYPFGTYSNAYIVLVAYYFAGNTALGNRALPNTGGGYENTAIGNYALYSLVESYGNAKNTAIGAHALGDLTNGLQNTAVGYQAGLSVPNGAYATTIVGTYTGGDIENRETIIGSGLPGKAAIRASDEGYVSLPYQPALYAFNSTNYNLTDNQLITFNNATVNRGSRYNTGTSTFSVPKNGAYFVTAKILTQNTQSACDIRIAKNGLRLDAYAGYALNFGSLASHKQGHVSGIVQCIAGDTLSIRSVGNIDVYGATAGHTSLTIYFLG